jgi:hypothetical protein
MCVILNSLINFCTAGSFALTPFSDKAKVALLLIFTHIFPSCATEQLRSKLNKMVGIKVIVFMVCVLIIETK